VIIKNLGNTDFKVIIDCFLLAFKNYFVPMPTDPNFYKSRWEAAGVRYDLSYGKFDDEQLVGFIINAIDKRLGKRTAYNTGTGVIPDYRGQRIVKSIYEYAIPQLMKEGIEKCQLEVITENDRAINSYEGIGFKICKNYKCYKATLSTQGYTDYAIKKVSHRDMDWSLLPNQKFYSWDNQKESLIKGNFEYYQVWFKGKLQSYFIMNSNNDYIAQFEVLEDTNYHWNTLLSAIKSINKEVRTNNIDDRLVSKIKAIESKGWSKTVDQYEMELNLI
jgi:GNAT superfamily N-acetyltransferase